MGDIFGHGIVSDDATPASDFDIFGNLIASRNNAASIWPHNPSRHLFSSQFACHLQQYRSCATGATHCRAEWFQVVSPLARNSFMTQVCILEWQYWPGLGKGLYYVLRCHVIFSLPRNLNMDDDLWWSGAPSAIQLIQWWGPTLVDAWTQHAEQNRIDSQPSWHSAELPRWSQSGMLVPFGIAVQYDLSWSIVAYCGTGKCIRN